MEKKKWIQPNTITGPPAEGKFYLRREYINEEFWREIEKGNHILFVAPRRLGKTSIMVDLANNCPPTLICDYNNLESIKTQEDLYKRLFRILLAKLNSVSQIKVKLLKWLKVRDIGEIGKDGFKISKREIDYKEELLLLISELRNLDKKVVLFLDEVPEVIFSIIKENKESDAIELLHTLREIRLNREFAQCKMVIAGSIGLEYVVETIDRLKLINDLHPITLDVLSRIEAIQLIKQITKGASMQISEQVMEYLLDRISNFIPYAIQILIEECDRLLHREERPELYAKDVDSAFDMIMKEKESFSDWQKRLKNYLPCDHYKFCKEILDVCSRAGKITIQQIYDYSKKWKIEEFMGLLSMLERDGYLMESGDRIYTFISPLLQIWWKKHNPETF
jgi:uncharacterized protein